MSPKRKSPPKHIVKSVAYGACRLVRVTAGLELRIYATKDEALADGVPLGKVEKLFIGRELHGLCRMWVHEDGTMQCADAGCDGNCYIIEDSKVLPRPPYLQKGSQTITMKPNSVYGCKCMSRFLE